MKKNIKQIHISKGRLFAIGALTFFFSIFMAALVSA
jgi:hypothetical protein